MADFLLRIILCLVLISLTVSLRYDLQSGHIKCISENIPVKALAVGKYSVVNPYDPNPLPDSHKVGARVSSPSGNTVHSSNLTDSGTFAFTSTEAGDYLACFWTPEHEPALTITLDFEWRAGVSAKNWGSVAKKGQIESMEMELKKMLDAIYSVHDDLFYLRVREMEMQEMNRSTNSKLAWLSFFSLVICLIVAGFQFYHLKNYFEKKKIL